jgi:hypothetical protein
MTRSSAKRVARRQPTAKRDPRLPTSSTRQYNLKFADQFPEPDFGTVAKGVKIVQITCANGGQGVTTFGLGKDGKVYVWNGYLGGWVLNVMGEEEKAKLKISIAVQQKLLQEGSVGGGAATEKALADHDRLAKANGAAQNPVAEALKREAHEAPDQEVDALS